MPGDARMRIQETVERVINEGCNGLGLAIAKSYTEICDGEFEVIVDGDMFKTILKFRKYN